MTPTNSCGTENTAVVFVDAKIERYPDRVGHTVLWAGAQAMLAAWL